MRVEHQIGSRKFVLDFFCRIHFFEPNQLVFPMSIYYSGYNSVSISLLSTSKHYQLPFGYALFALTHIFLVSRTHEIVAPSFDLDVLLDTIKFLTINKGGTVEISFTPH